MHAIILSGGVGSRLWPISRELYPKPFIRLADNQSFLQKVFIRCLSMPRIASITNVTNTHLWFKMRDEYKEIASDHQEIDVNYLLEPFGRNTAAAIAAASLQIVKLYGKDATLLVLPSDHIISDQIAFNDAVSRGELLAKQGKIVVFGVTPNKPETGYGYIEITGNNDVAGFFEKPSLPQAEMYFKSKKFLWNSGIFCFKAATMLQEMEEFCPDILSSVKNCLLQSSVLKKEQLSKIELDSTTFAQVREDSIDYAIMEKSSNLAVIACDIGWKDVGNWNAMCELSECDSLGNNLNGDTILHNVTNCYIKGDSRVIGAVGVDNLIIIDTPDALLIADKSKSQEVKDVYVKLKHQQHTTHKSHKTVHRPWGVYTILEEGQGFKIKRIEVEPKASLSLQMHYHRSEHWVVVSGTAEVVNGSNTFMLNVNESTYISAGTTHRLSNPDADTKLVIIEIQTGSYLGEDDIVRFDDIYNRVANG